MTTSLWKPSPKASGSGPTSARRRASGTFEAVRSSREKRAFDWCDRKCSLIGRRKTHECAAWAAPPATTRRNLLSASSDESREYSNTLVAALDGPKRSKSLCMRYSCSTALRSTDLACRGGRENRSVRRRTSPGIPSPNRVWRCIFSFEFQPVAVWDVCVMCTDIMWREKQRRDSSHTLDHDRPDVEAARGVPSRGMVARPRVVCAFNHSCPQ